jgi:hypothetical protein
MTRRVLKANGQSRVSLALLALAALLIAHAATAAGIHDRGNTVLSFGGSVSHTTYNDRHYETDLDQSAVDLSWLTEAEIADLYADTPTEDDAYGDYEGIDTSVFLSAGYFVIDRLELGLSGSTMVTVYHGGGTSDLYIYDVELYSKYFFENESSFTPYVGVRGGLSWLDIGTYKENNTVAGFSAGLEFSGMGAFSWFLEYSSRYTWNDDDLTGTEWRNRLYVGVTYYFDFFEDDQG